MNGKRYRLPVLLAILLTSLALPHAAGAADSLPGWTAVRPEKPMTPEDFRQYLEKSSKEEAKAAAALPADGGAMALSMEAGDVLNAEIDALARGLKYDPGLMYQFVHDHIRFYPMWGEVKSAAMTLLDRSGDAFDQALLMMELLTRANGHGYTITNIKYVLGTIQLNAAQITNWLNVPDNAAVVADVLGAAGIPRTVHANGDGTINYVEMEHVWVKATINGTIYVFDASFKSHTLKAGLTNSQLEAALGYTQSAFLTSAQQGATIGTDYVQHLNKGNITSNLSSYSTSLIDYIKANYPAGDVADIIGGQTIVPAPQSPLPPPVPYPRSAIGEYLMGGLPGSCITTLHIQHGGINQTFHTAAIYGHRLLLTFPPGAHPYESYVLPSLWLDGQLKTTAWYVSPGSSFDLALTVTHAGQTGESKTLTVKAGGMWHIVNGWGDVGTRIIEQHRRILQQNRHDGLADDSKEVLGESFTLTGLTWAAEVCRMQSLVSQLSNCTIVNQHLIGVMGQYQAPYIDMPLCRSATASHTGDSAAETAAFLAIGGPASAYEYGVIQQLQDYNAVSTVKLLDIANDRTTYNKIFAVTSANWSSIKSQLQQSGHGYSAGEIAEVDALVTAGDTIYLPEYGDLGEGDWKGIGYLATKFDPNSWHATYGISGGYNGGYTAWADKQYQALLAFYCSDVSISQSLKNQTHQATPEPIDLVTGAYTYDHTDIDVGNGRFPFGLGLDRHYNSIQRLEDGPLGLGWTHGFDITTKVASDSFRAMGEDSAIDAAANIAALHVTFDLFRSPSVLNNVVASLSEKWLMDQMIDNIAVVKQGHEAMEFVKLPDNSFNPPPGKALRLSKQPDNTYLLKDPAGNFLSFDASNRALRWSDPHGNVVDFAYNTNGKLATVTGKIGGSEACRSLSFTYGGSDPNHISTVTDSANRSISFGYDPNHNLTSYTDPEGHATTFNYDTANDGQLLQVFYPNNPTQPYVTNVYDALGRVMQQTNAAGQVYDYFYSDYRTEELEPLQTPPSGIDARYAKVYWFDDHGQTVAVQDELGRTTTTEYDGQQRPTRVVAPTGTAVEYSYDLDHNVTETRAKPVAGSVLPDIVSSATYTTHETAGGRWLNKLATQTDAAGHTTTYEYDFSNPAYQAEFGDLRKVTLPQVIDYQGQPVTAAQLFTYTAYGQPETVTDANGIVTKYEYDTPAQGGGLKKTTVDFGTDPQNLNLTTQCTYDPAGDVNSVTDAQGHVTQSTYFPSRRLQKTIAPAPFQYETTYAYYPEGQLHYVQQALPGGFASDPNCVARWNLEEGALTADAQGTNTLTNTGVVASSTHKEGAWAGDFTRAQSTCLSIADSSLSSGFPLKSGDTNKRISVCAWIRIESLGAVQYLFSKWNGPSNKRSFAVILDAAGHVGHLTGYNSGASYEDNWSTATLAAGLWYHLSATYDDGSRAWTLRVWNDSTSSFVINLSGTKTHNLAVTDAPWTLGNAQGGSVYYDGLLDQVAVFNDILTAAQIDRIRQGAYDSPPRTIVLQEHTYTAAGEPNTVRGPYQLGQPTQDNYTQYTYDALDRPWKVTDAEGHVTETRYWPDGQLWRTIDAAGHSALTRTYYDPNGLLYSVADAQGNTTVYDYDHFRRPLRTWYPDNSYEEVSYDAYGRVSQTRTRAGALAQPTYDTWNRVVSKTIAGSTTTYGYDLAGRTVNTADPVGTLHNTFDRLGRVSAATGTNGKKVSYEYDTLGRRSQLTYPDNSFVTYGYDELGRLTEVKDQNGSTLAGYSYDDLSRRVSLHYANGTSSLYTYSDTDRLLQLSHTTTTRPATYGYTYDLVGNRTSMTVNGNQHHGYTYDPVYQLTDANYPAGYFRPYTTFTYDPAGNRSQVTSPPTTYLTNNLNQYTTVGSDSFSYDTNGNLTSDGHNSYTYDAQSRLVTAVAHGQTIQYTYDAAGRRIRKDTAGRATQYVYDGDQVIAEYDGAGTRLRTFVYGPGIDEPICLRAYNLAIGDVTGDRAVNLSDLLALGPKWLLTSADSGYDLAYDLNQDGRIDNGDTDVLATYWLKAAPAVQTFYYHGDALGSVVALSDAAGHVVTSYAYDVYGQAHPAGPAVGNPYRFAGYRFEVETGLYFCRARYYDPALGRFLQPDPSGYADGINWYPYCGNDPIMLVDPLGLCGGGGRYNANITAGDFVGGWLGGIPGTYQGIGYGLYNGAAGLYSTVTHPIQSVGNAVSGLASGAGHLWNDPWGTVSGVGSSIYNTGATLIGDDRVASGTLIGEGWFGASASAVGAKVVGGVTARLQGTTSEAAATGGRLGNAATRAQIGEIQAELESRGWTVQKGGTLGEEYIPGPGGARAGSAYPDITATKNGRTLRINTIDTLSDGMTPTAREAANAAKIRSLRPNDHLLLVPKPQ